MREINKRGFTIIELMLAMSFISALLLAIVMTAIQAGRIYNKGLTLQSVNQAGGSIGDTLRRDFLQTNAQMVSRGPVGAVIFTQDGGKDVSARFCLGGFSYLWNIPQESSVVVAPSALVLDSKGVPINFVRVPDSGGSLCEPLGAGGYENNLPESMQVTHLLKQSSDSAEVGLAIHELQVSPLTSTEGKSEALYRVEYTIGTSKLSEIDTADQRCRPPSDERSNDDFCAINNFEMIVRTNGQ